MRDLFRRSHQTLALLRSSGFAITAHPDREVYLVTRRERHHAVEPAPFLGDASKRELPAVPLGTLKFTLRLRRAP